VKWLINIASLKPLHTLQITTSPEVPHVFNNYPEQVRPQMQCLRNLIINTAKEIEHISSLEETLKWGEPSYVTKHGSTLRIDWKPKTPNRYAMYFQCTSKLVPTFRIMYRETFTFEGSRAIVFKLNETLPVDALKKCIKATLTYHKVKHLPALGM
jgi:hypothetical protein